VGIYVYPLKGETRTVRFIRDALVFEAVDVTTGRGRRREDMRPNEQTPVPSRREFLLRQAQPVEDSRCVRTCVGASLEGFITDADLPAAECEWPGLQAFFLSLAVDDRPRTFLDLIWRFENRESGASIEARVVITAA
jgi:hypothetical protein